MAKASGAGAHRESNAGYLHRRSEVAYTDLTVEMGIRFIRWLKACGGRAEYVAEDPKPGVDVAEWVARWAVKPGEFFGLDASGKPGPLVLEIGYRCDCGWESGLDGYGGKVALGNWRQVAMRHWPDCPRCGARGGGAVVRKAGMVPMLPTRTS